MPLESPTNLRYSIVIGTTETILVSTPKGWSEEAVARTRSTEDFGVNQEISLRYFPILLFLYCPKNACNQYRLNMFLFLSFLQYLWILDFSR